MSLDTIIGRVITSRCPERMWGGDAGIYSYERGSIAQEIRALCVIILVEVDRLFHQRLVWYCSVLLPLDGPMLSPMEPPEVAESNVTIQLTPDVANWGPLTHLGSVSHHLIL